MKKVDWETFQIYKNEFRAKYPVSPKVQPNFWKAVWKRCNNPDEDVSGLLTKKKNGKYKNYCIPKWKKSGGKFFSHIASIDTSCKDIMDCVDKIATAIRNKN